MLRGVTKKRRPGAKNIFSQKNCLNNFLIPSQNNFFAPGRRFLVIWIQSILKKKNLLPPQLQLVYGDLLNIN